ncbi:lipopolysaccharide biosynthesis protein [Streptomyces sp. NBC_00448]|uniref:lipopolysaccharide biosynthesis protein n=1 Tax=Streptomyces sp. NBC_00448 TaxID=2903652 RepID=UPI002E1E5774
MAEAPAGAAGGRARRLGRRALAVLPPGTALVGAGTAVLGLASYIQLAAAGRTLPSDRMAGVSVLWTLVFSVGLGLFFPIEQEMTRLVAARVVAGEGTGPVLRRGLATSLGLLAAVCVPVAVFAHPVANRLFDGNLSLVGALCAAFGALSVAYVTRGMLAGTGRFRVYGTQLALDGALRVVFSVLLAAAGTHSPLLFAAVLTVPTLLSVAATLPWVLRAARYGAEGVSAVKPAAGADIAAAAAGVAAGAVSGGDAGAASTGETAGGPARTGGATALRSSPPLPWRALWSGLLALIPSTLLAQLLVNISVISVKLLAPDDTAFITALLSAVVLARVPLFVFGSLQASLLRGLSEAVAAGDRAAYRQLLLRTAAFTGLLGGTGGVVAVALGPWLVPRLFGSPDLLGWTDFAWLSAGTLCYMLASVLGQALQTTGGHGRQLVSWAVGTAALLAVTFSPLPIRDRVEIAYAVGAAITAILLSIRVTYAIRMQPMRHFDRQAGWTDAIQGTNFRDPAERPQSVE